MHTCTPFTPIKSHDTVCGRCYKRQTHTSKKNQHDWREEESAILQHYIKLSHTTWLPPYKGNHRGSHFIEASALCNRWGRHKCLMKILVFCLRVFFWSEKLKWKIKCTVTPCAHMSANVYGVSKILCPLEIFFSFQKQNFRKKINKEIQNRSMVKNTKMSLSYGLRLRHTATFWSCSVFCNRGKASCKALKRAVSSVAVGANGNAKTDQNVIPSTPSAIR